MSFKFDKCVDKLERFKDLSKEKQLKLLKKILTDEEALEWQFDPNKDNGQTGVEMIQKFYKLLANPAPMKVYPDLLDKYGKSDFSRSSIVIMNSILVFGLNNSNEMLQSLTSEINANGNSVETREEKAKLEKYNKYLDGLRDTIQTLAKPYLKKLEKETNLSRDMIFRALMVAPEPAMIQKHRITPLTMQILNELYSEASVSGFRSAGVRWKPLWTEIFGVQEMGSVAVSILLEGCHRIDKFRDSKKIADVGLLWDSLTNWALNVLEHAPDDDRKHAIELYLKKAENLVSRRKDKPVDFRVNLTSLGREFRNIAATVDFYRKRFDGLSRVRFGDRDDRDNRDRDRRDRDHDRDRDRDNDRRDRRRDDDWDRRREDESPKSGLEKGISTVVKSAREIGSLADSLARLAGDDDYSVRWE